MQNPINLVMQLPRRALFSYRSIVSQEPACWFLYQPYIWHGQRKLKAAGVSPQERIVSSATQLVIDGFPGSANSFAALAFKRSQKQYINLAHHLHSPSQILQAIEREIPVLLTIREPVGAILSIASRRPYITATQGLHTYIGFYSKLKPYSSHYVISTFEQSTQHLDRMIARVNSVFNTNFDWVDIATANADRQTKKAQRDSEKLAIRESIREEKRQEFTLEKNAQLLIQAKALYQAYEELAHQRQ
ncbi:MAG TPA: hypothetical protein DD379_22805 [Cyanobacteria bacterium UBA11162]|nr:hypothetical protein [Cyanobacteria bacterium UBA11162]